MQQVGTLVLIPIPIAPEAWHTLPPEVHQHTGSITHFFVENLRTARRFLKAIHPAIVIDDLHFSEIDKHSGADGQLLRQWLKSGHTIGVMSEAGCPGIADPGAELAAIAQDAGARVMPLTGPNSMILSLMASGLNGQSFAFNGYLPVKESARSARIKVLESLSRKERQTQLFIETPYRNNQLLEDLLKHCQPSTRLCIALDVTGSGEKIVTRTIAEWKKEKPVLDKAPAVFLFLAAQ